MNQKKSPDNKEVQITRVFSLLYIPTIVHIIVTETLQSVVEVFLHIHTIQESNVNADSSSSSISRQKKIDKSSTFFSGTYVGNVNKEWPWKRRNSTITVEEEFSIMGVAHLDLRGWNWNHLPYRENQVSSCRVNERTKKTNRLPLTFVLFGCFLGRTVGQQITRLIHLNKADFNGTRIFQ